MGCGQEGSLRGWRIQAWARGSKVLSSRGAQLDIWGSSVNRDSVDGVSVLQASLLLQPGGLFWEQEWPACGFSGRPDPRGRRERGDRGCTEAGELVTPPFSSRVRPPAEVRHDTHLYESVSVTLWGHRRPGRGVCAYVFQPAFWEMVLFVPHSSHARSLCVSTCAQCVCICMCVPETPSDVAQALASCCQRCHPELGKGSSVFSFPTASRKGDGVARGGGVWLLAGPHPSSVVQDPLGRWGRGELLPWWPVCSKFLPGAAGDIYTQGQAESGQAAEGRRARAGTVWAERPLVEVCEGRWGWACHAGLGSS